MLHSTTNMESQEEQQEQPQPSTQQLSPTKPSLNPWMLSTFALLILLALVSVYALSQKQKETPTTFQPTTPPAVNQPTPIPLPTQTPDSSEISCNNDKDCSEESFCDYGFSCKESPDASQIGCTKIYSGSKMCIKKCSADSDCIRGKTCQTFYIPKGSDIAFSMKGCR